MGNEQVPGAATEIYIDKLTLLPTLFALRLPRFARVTVLEKVTRGQRCWIALLRLRGVLVKEATFFAGHLASSDGESVYLAASRIAGVLSLRASESVVDGEPELARLNASYGRNTIRLYIAKQLRAEISQAVSRVLVAKALCPATECRCVIKQPAGVDPELLTREFRGVDVTFYGGFAARRISPMMLFFRTVASDLKLTFSRGAAPRRIVSRRAQRSVLAIQEDTIRADRSRRGQPHWLDAEHAPNDFETFVVRFGLFAVADSAAVLKAQGITALPRSVFRSAIRAHRRHAVLRRVRRDRRRAITTLLFRRAGVHNIALVHAASLLRQAELAGAIALWLDVGVFVVRETYYPFSDAMQLVAPDLNVATIAYQYSNLGGRSTNLLSTADKFLIFSDAFRPVFRADGICPGEFVTTGYLYDGVARLVRDRARMHREQLTRAGAEFVVCYFDESVQHHRWGLVSRDDHLSELHALAAAVISDPTFGVVVKSQFNQNSPSRTYPGDDLLMRAKASGRYLELIDGELRNDIYPTEAALVADLCVGHKFGATASLEAAIAGVRSVLLDGYQTRTQSDDLYASADIVYATIESLMEAVRDHRAGLSAARNLGDWSQILDQFDPYRDGHAADRLRKLVAQSLHTSSHHST